MFSRIVHFYGIDPDALMKSPIRRFWMLDSNIAKIRAESDMRNMRVFNAAQSSEGAKQTLDHLVLEMGTVVKTSKHSQLEETLDEAGLEELRMMMM